jgi:hypothetical protein
MDALGSKGAYPLDLPFKGTRDYLHGTDIFDALLRVSGARDRVVLILRRPMRHPVDVVPFHSMPNPTAYHAEFHYVAGRRTRTLVLRENSSRKVTHRIAYDENDVTAAAEITDGSLKCQISSSYSFIEHVVALNKVLLNSFSPAVSSPRWLFARIELDTIPQAPKVLDLKLVASIGSRITKTELGADGCSLGHIYFSRQAR